METIEKTGDTVEDAINAGLEELGVSPEDVMVEILEEPSRGLLGLGAKPARVRLVLMGQRRSETDPKRESDADPAQGNQKDSPLSDASSALDESEVDEEAIVGKEIVLILLEKMNYQCAVTIHRAEPARPEEGMHWILNITGKDMRFLIGKRGETLASLQYITRLIVSRRLQRRANIIIDAAGYKSNRSDRLKGLASRLADQAVNQGRTISLEPMPPNERRIIHLTLRERPDVTTHSVGEGKSRKVTIVPS